MPTIRAIRALSVAFALAVALPAAAADEPHDPCKNPTSEELQNAELQQECKYIAEAEAINAELNKTTAALREAMRVVNKLVDRKDAIA
jgi:hypothetical protein